MILAGDIGGTKTNLAFFEVEGDKLKTLDEATFSSQEFRSLEELMQEFLGSHSYKVDLASLSIAGPVINGTCKATNIPWNVDSATVSTELGFNSTWLINDLEANAHGITHLGEDEYVVLHAGKPGMHGNACVVSAGTGLGEAGMFWNGDGYIPFACEGGHTDFGPRNEEQIDLLRYIRRDHRHVSYERVLSGMGMVRGLTAQIQAKAPWARVRPLLVKISRIASKLFSHSGLTVPPLNPGNHSAWLRTSLLLNVVSGVNLPVKIPIPNGPRFRLAKSSSSHKASSS